MSPDDNLTWKVTGTWNPPPFGVPKGGGGPGQQVCGEPELGPETARVALQVAVRPGGCLYRGGS